MSDIIRWENRQQKILWDKEMSGQVSDGMWENANPMDHWKRPCSAASVVARAGEEPGLNFRPMKSYRFNSAELLSIVGDRMLAEVQLHFPDYTWRDMQLDLRAMGRLFREARKRYAW